MLRYQLFPRSVGVTSQLQQIIQCFEVVYDEIKSPEHGLNSDGVLAHLRPHLEQLGFRVETGKSKGLKIPIPVLFGLNNHIDRSFDADGLSLDGTVVLEVEAGRAVVNYQFLKDIFQACLHNVEYLVLAVRNNYRGHDDFQAVHTFLETLYISNRLRLGYLRPVDYYRGNPAVLHEARRQKLRQARHQRKEANLGLEQRTLPLETGEGRTEESG